MKSEFILDTTLNAWHDKEKLDSQFKPENDRQEKVRLENNAKEALRNNEKVRLKL